MIFDAQVFFWQLMVTTLTTLCVLSAIIGYISKERSFIFYGIYTFFLLFYFVLRSPYELSWLETLNTSYHPVRFYTQVIYNCSYFLFFLTFLDIKKHFPGFYRFIIRVVGTSFLMGTIAFWYAMLSGDFLFFDDFYIFIFVPVLFCFAVYTIIKATQLEEKLKYFFIIGGSAMVIGAMVALFSPIVGWWPFRFESIAVFYVGIFFEQTIFALGLAYKVKTINRALISKSLENQKIKEQQNELLSKKLKEREREALKLTEKAEKERLERVKSGYEEEISRLRLQVLQNQMKPHFIFNALSAIKFFLIKGDNEKASLFLNKFSRFLRSILKSTENRVGNLREELDFLSLYINIENTRLTDKIEFKVSNPENINLGAIVLPPMILQPFIDNAIWHGLSSKQGPKTIALKIKKIDNTVVLTITDNGVGRRKSGERRQNRIAIKSPKGLNLVRERLDIFNKKHARNYKFVLQDMVDNQGNPIGTEVKIVLGKSPEDRGSEVM